MHVDSGRERSALALERGDIHVWSAELDVTDAVVRRFMDVVSGEEYERAMRFCFERDRRRSIACRGILREILGAYLAADPTRLVFQYGQFGKPALAGGSEDRVVRFNVSHSHGRALYAVAHGQEVGIDLEFVRPLNDMASLAETCFTAAEKAALEALPQPERLRGFYDAWTRKEAFLKATGDGLSRPLHSFEVSLAPGRGPRALTLIESRNIESAWTLVSLEPYPEFSAALVVEGRHCRLTCAEWSIDTTADPVNAEMIAWRAAGGDEIPLPSEGQARATKQLRTTVQ